MVSERFKQLREALGKSQTEFGAGLGVSRSVINNIERSVTEPSDVFLNHLCDVYNVNRNWIETGEGEMFDPPADETDMAIVQRFVSDVGGNELIRSIMKCWAGLEPTQRKALTGFIDGVFEDYQRRKAEAATVETQTMLDDGEADLDNPDQKQA